MEKAGHSLRPICIDVYVVDDHSVHIVDQHVELICPKVNSELKGNNQRSRANRYMLRA